MKNNIFLIRTCALLKFLTNHYPNYNKEDCIPEEAVFLAYKKMTNLSLYSFYNFRDELRMLGVLFKEGKYLRIFDKDIMEDSKKLSEIEKKISDNLLNKLKKELKY